MGWVAPMEVVGGGVGGDSLYPGYHAMGSDIAEDQRCRGLCGPECDGAGRRREPLVVGSMKMGVWGWVGIWILGGSLVLGQTSGTGGTNSAEKAAKPRPPRIPDGPMVPKRGMMQREKEQFWAGPEDGNRFVEILTLTLISKEQLQAKLEEWPPYQKFSEPQKARLLERINEFRNQARKEALEVAQDFQLGVSPENQEDFIRKYWMEKLGIEKALRDELSPLRKRLEGEAQKRLERDFKKIPN